jgi:hypothetical protein
VRGVDHLDLVVTDLERSSSSTTGSCERAAWLRERGAAILHRSHF